MDNLTTAVIEAIERVATDVTVTIDSDSVTASAVVDGHTHIVNGDDDYHAVCLLAEKVGVELEDG